MMYIMKQLLFKAMNLKIRKHFFSIRDAQNIEEIRRQKTENGPQSDEVVTKTLSVGVDNISLSRGVTIHKSSGAYILPQDSQVVKQDDKMNEDEAGITPYKNIKIQDEVNVLDKTEGIGIVSDNGVEVTPGMALFFSIFHILFLCHLLLKLFTTYTVTRTRLEEYKHFVDLDDSQISLLVEAITTYPHLWNACEKFRYRFQAWMLKTLADMLLFLRSESVDSVNPQKEKEFHKLCDEVIQLGFERLWVDDMRQRVVARNPKLDHAKARIGELLKTHDHLTQQLDNIKKELKSLNDFVDAQTKYFDFL